ncbi:MAG: uracil-DNA glycosylase [Acidobacteria bacterium]|nr:uracil-DNA glycosylase [Acidobacteriota bacterium]MCB9397593.1 uracil-DNA glycosylase [Acidobacteriota bacterium]
MNWNQLNQTIADCNQCSRLREHCQKVAENKRAAYRDQTYWGRPVPNLGHADARLLIVGLAPAAHGANRTGRMFTGDKSGDFLFASLFRTGWANQAHSNDRNDGLQLIDACITAAVHCAPPANKPTLKEERLCFPYLQKTVALMPRLTIVLALGGIGFKACLALYRDQNWQFTKKPIFGHGVWAKPEQGPILLGSYHPSQQNTFTGRLTPEMLDQVLQLARELTKKNPGM